MSFIALPFGFPGRVFRSPMPFGPYDLHGEVYDRFCEEQIAVIVLLASDEECLHKTRCNLRALYHKAGFQVLYLPIPDFGVPTPATWNREANKRSSSQKPDNISLFIFFPAMDELECLLHYLPSRC